MKFIIFIIIFSVAVGIISDYRAVRDGVAHPEDSIATIQEHLSSLKIAGLIASAVILLILAVLLAATKKWRKINVFIAFQHQRIEAAKKIKEHLNKSNLTVDYIPFETDAEHDRIVNNARTMIRSSDVMLTLPGQDASFVDAEVFAASTLRRVIAFIKTDDHQKLPDTSYRGYPVFNYDKLCEKDFLPLNHFLNFSCSHLKDGISIIRRAMPKSFGGWYFITFMFFMNIVQNTVGIFGYDRKLIFLRYFIYSSLAIAALLFMARLTVSVIKRIRLTKIARQAIRTGKYTFQELKNALGHLKKDQEILECLEQNPLDYRYIRLQ